MRAFVLLLLVACNNDPITSEPDAKAPPIDGGKPDVIAPADGGPDGSVTSTPGWVSGSRLRAKVIVSSDGAKQFAGWYDSMRKEDCAMQNAVDKMRCIPAVGPGSGSITDVYFSDSNCTVPLGSVAKGCNPKYLLHVENQNSCNGTYRVRVFTAGMLSNPSTFYSKSGNQCNATAYSSIYPDLFTVGAEIQPTVFADAQETTE